MTFALLAALAVSCRAAASAAPDPARWTQRVLRPLWVYAQDLAEGDGLDHVTLVDVTFAQTVTALPSVERRPEDGVYTVHNFAGRSLDVPWDEVQKGEGAEASALDGLGKAGDPDLRLPLEPLVREHVADFSSALKRAWVRSVEGGMSPDDAWAAIVPDWAYFGFRPEGVAVGSSIEARARAQSLKFLRHENAAFLDAPAPGPEMLAAARRAWLAAQSTIHPTQFLLSEEQIRAALPKAGLELSNKTADAARRAQAWRALLQLTQTEVKPLARWQPDRLFIALDPPASAVLAQALAGGSAPGAAAPDEPPPAAAAVEPLFEEMTSTAGLQPPASQDVLDVIAIGSGWVDYDRDGKLDFYARRGRMGGRLYRNLGGGKFADVTDASGVGRTLFGVGDRAVAGDYDNDGWPDLFVIGTITDGHHLFHNDHGVYRDVTEKAGLRESPGLAVGALWLDYDHDGRLDLLVIHMGRYRDGVEPTTRDVHNGLGLRLYHNNGDGTFTDVTAKAGLASGRWAWAAQSFDYDGDTWPDIFECDIFGRSVLYRNKGDGTFEDVTSTAGIDVPNLCKGVSVADVNHDGHPDLYLSMVSASNHLLSWRDPAYPDRPLFDAGKFSAGYYGPGQRDHDLLYINDGHGHFQEHYADYFSTTVPGFNWNGFFADYDLDGYPDLYVVNGFYPDVLFFHDERKQLLHFDPKTKHFSPVGQANGADIVGVSRGSIYADYDGDGCPDLVPEGLHGLRLLRNRCLHAGHWLKIKLRGTKSNRDGLGAHVEVRAGDLFQSFEYGTEGGGSINAYPGYLLVGLGAHERADSIEVRWPSGRRQKVGPQECGRLVEVVEP